MTQFDLDSRKIQLYHEYGMKTKLLIACITVLGLSSCWHGHRHDPPPPRTTNYYVAPGKVHHQKPKPKPKPKYKKYKDPRYYR